MALDPSLILKGETPNMGEAFQKGAANQAALNTSQAQLPGIQADSALKQAALPYQQASAKLDQAVKENQLGIQLISSVTDQRSLDAALQTAQKYGIDTSRFPKVYDPSAIQQIAMGALTAKDRLENHYKDLQVNMEQNKFKAEYPNAAGANVTTGGTLGAPNIPSAPSITPGPLTQPDDQGSITPPQKPPIAIDDPNQQAVTPQLPVPGAMINTPQPTNMGDAMLQKQPGAQQMADDFQPQYNAKGEPMKGVDEGTQLYVNSKGERKQMRPEGDDMFNKQTPPDLHGDTYLKTIPDARNQSYLKSVANGDIPLPTPRGKAEQQSLMDLTAAVKQYDPTFYSGRSDAVKDFRSGDQAKQIATFSKSIEHLDTLSALAQNLNNTSSPTFNALANEVSKQTGAAKVTNFNTAKEIVAKELDKAIAGAGGSTISGTEDAKAQLEAASSPEQLTGAIKTIEDLMGGQLKGIEQTYKTSVGGDGFASLLTPKAAEVFGKYEAPASKPSSVKEGATATNAMGHKITFKGGKWQ